MSDKILGSQGQEVSCETVSQVTELVELLGEIARATLEQTERVEAPQTRLVRALARAALQVEGRFRVLSEHGGEQRREAEPVSAEYLDEPPPPEVSAETGPDDYVFGSIDWGSFSTFDLNQVRRHVSNEIARREELGRSLLSKD
jgi:hypothetical protein